MFGKIVYISDSLAHISIPAGTPVNMDLMNMHVVFEDGERKVLGEVADVSESIIKVNFLGVIDNKLSLIVHVAIVLLLLVHVSLP